MENTQLLQNRYRAYRQQGTSVFAALLTTLLIGLCWIVLPLESPSWQNVRANWNKWFPQISTTHPLPADGLRFLLQSLWLLLVFQNPEPKLIIIVKRWLKWQRKLYYAWLQILPEKIKHNILRQKILQQFKQLSDFYRRTILVSMSIFAAVLALICISHPFGLISQFIFAVLLLSVAVSVRRIPGRLPAIMLVVLSITVSTRYLWWRYTTTLNWNHPLDLVCGVLLLSAETYAWIVLILGHFQTIWPLHRNPVTLPADTSHWPTVDIMIPTYNEDLSILKPTVYAAVGMDWPKDKINIYILDDGNRPSFKIFADQVGVHYIARPTHEHAKAGNLNYALKQATGEFVAIFDCDHIPSRAFLQFTLGWFLKESNLALVQTPHHFFSPDPFERNLGLFRHTPNEGLLFYGLIQDGNDTWDSTFFCGSCGVLRRTALDKIGGLAVETVTEDAHTSLRLQRHGYNSAYIRIPLAAGLATESLADHITQRVRWARGMTQIFRVDNPLVGKGLKLSQRLYYTNAILYFFSGVPRLIFLTAPIAFLLLHAYVIFAPALMIVLYVLPHLIHAGIATSRVQSKFRHFFWGEIYETVLAWYITWPTLKILLNPYTSKFNVTRKGKITGDQRVDWRITRPYLSLLAINLLGIAAGIWRFIHGPSNEILTVTLSLVWALYNVIILGGAIAVAVEAKQIRKSQRVEITMPGAVATADGHLYPCTLKDYATNSVGIEMRETNLLHEGDAIALLLKRGQQEYVFPCEVTRVLDNNVGIRLKEPSTIQQINFIQCTFARADTWAHWERKLPKGEALKNLRQIFSIDFQGYKHVLHYTPLLVRTVFIVVAKLISWVNSFVPRREEQNQA